MGKKPLIGAVGVWIGLSLTGCSDCGCFHRNSSTKYQGDSTIFGSNNKNGESKPFAKTPDSMAGTGAATTPSGLPAAGAGPVTPTAFPSGNFGGADPVNGKAPATTPAATGGPSVSDAGTRMPGMNDAATFNANTAPSVKPAVGMTDPAAMGAAVKQTSQMMPLPNENHEPEMKLTQRTTLPSKAGSWANDTGAALNDAGATTTTRAPLAPPPVMSKTMFQNSTPLPGDSGSASAKSPPVPAPDAGTVPPPIPSPVIGSSSDLKPIQPPSFVPPPVPGN